MILQSVDQLPISFYQRLLFRAYLVRLYLSYTIESFVAKVEWGTISFVQVISHICTAPVFRWVYHIKRKGNQTHIYQSEQPYLIVSNHISRLDPVFIFASLPLSYFRRLLPVKLFTANQYLERFLTILQLFGAFPAYSIPQKKSGLRGGLYLLDRNFNLLIFPEGKRNLTGEKIDLKIGAAYLSKKRNIKLIPVYIKRNYKGISVTWGESFQIDHRTWESIEDYNKRIFNHVLELAN